MIFSSTLFLFIFLPVLIPLYYLIPKRFLSLRNMLLLSASLLFYAWGEPRNVFVMAASICINFFLVILIDRFRKTIPLKRLFLILALFINIGILFVFKYSFFAAENIGALFGFELNVEPLRLPIGISFYTFQIISYVLDVYFGGCKAQKNLFNLALYISFFPQLIAGPIVRYHDIEGMLAARVHKFENFAPGVRRFISGFAKKVLIANNVSVFADFAFGSDSPPALVAWVGAVAYAIQIYFDFSGYSDMAIGLAKMFGFDFQENFNYPYSAVSVQDFWRRWHMSLSSWFRDYLYIPLGGNRKGPLRTYINLFIVFMVTGLWHGANWTFVLWGLYHGMFLIAERAGVNKLLAKLPKPVCRLYTLLAVLIGWVLFRADNLAHAQKYLCRMFSFSENQNQLRLTLANMDIIILAALVFGIVLSAPVHKYLRAKIFGDINYYAPGQKLTPAQETASYAVIVCSFVLLLTSVMFLAGKDFNPFLYFNF